MVIIDDSEIERRCHKIQYWVKPNGFCIRLCRANNYDHNYHNHHDHHLNYNDNYGSSANFNCCDDDYHGYT